VKRINTLTCIAFFLSVLTNAQVDKRYAGFLINYSDQSVGVDIIFQGKITIAIDTEINSAWAVSGNDTIMYGNGLIITVDDKYHVISVDTGNFEAFIFKIRIENGLKSTSAGQSLGWLLRAKSLKWFEDNFPDDSLHLYKNTLEIFGSGKNNIVGQIESKIIATYDEKLKRIKKVSLRINMPDIGPDYQQDISEITDTFSIHSQWVEKQFNDYLLRYVWQSIIKPKENSQKVDSVTYLPPVLFSVKEMMDRLPSIGKQKIKKPCYYLVMYSYISCAPCMAAGKKIAEIDSFMTEKGIQTVVINKIDKPEQIRKYYHKTKRPYFTLYHTETNRDTNEIKGYPTLFIVDAKTNVVLNHQLGMSLDFQLKDWIYTTIEKNGK